MTSIGDAWAIIKKVDRLLDLEEKQSKAIAGLQDQLDALTDRVTRLEAREDIVVAEAKGAAGVAAAGAMAELARRIGVLEGSRASRPPRVRKIKSDPSP